MGDERKLVTFSYILIITYIISTFLSQISVFRFVKFILGALILIYIPSLYIIFIIKPGRYNITEITFLSFVVNLIFYAGCLVIFSFFNVEIYQSAIIIIISILSMVGHLVIKDKNITINNDLREYRYHIWILFICLIVLVVKFNSFIFKEPQEFIVFYDEKPINYDAQSNYVEVYFLNSNQSKNDTYKFNKVIKIVYLNKLNRSYYYRTKFLIGTHPGTIIKYRLKNDYEKNWAYPFVLLFDYIKLTKSDYFSRILINKNIELKPGINSLTINLEPNKNIPVPNGNLLVDYSDLSHMDIRTKFKNKILMPIIPKYLTLQEFFYYSLLQTKLPYFTLHQPPFGFVVNAISMLLVEKSFMILPLMSLFSIFLSFIILLKLVSIKLNKYHKYAIYLLIVIVISNTLLLFYSYDIILVDSLFVLFYLISIYALLLENKLMFLISSVLLSFVRYPGAFLILSTLTFYYLLYKNKRRLTIKHLKNYGVVMIILIGLILMYLTIKGEVYQFIKFLYTETFPEHFSYPYVYSGYNLIIFLVLILLGSVFLPIILLFTKKDKIAKFLLLSLFPYAIIISSISWPHIRYNIPFVYILSIGSLRSISQIKKSKSILLIFIMIGFIVLFYLVKTQFILGYYELEIISKLI